MDADFSIELGREDPVLDLPWTDPEGKLAYFDLKRLPELLGKIEEAKVFPEMREFLRTLNSSASIMETAKCDVWAETELNAEEEIYDAGHKFSSYVDAVFSELHLRLSFSIYEGFVRDLVQLLRRKPETPTLAEVCVRRCYFEDNGTVREGFYLTLYVNGYGNSSETARRNWAVGLNLVAHAIVELSLSLRP